MSNQKFFSIGMGPDKRKLLKQLPETLNETCQPTEMVEDDVKKNYGRYYINCIVHTILYTS